VKAINQYGSLKEFTTDIDAAGGHLPFKIMGKRRLPDPKSGFSGIYYTLSMLAEVYQDIDDPDQIAGFQSVPTPFGEILRMGCRLWGGDRTFSKTLTPNAKTGSNLLQADIVELDLSAAGGFPKHRLAMITSHSCAISNAQVAAVVPVYTESELDEAAITVLRGVKPKNAAQIRGNWLSNEQVNYLGLPGAHIAGINDTGDRMLACLHLQTAVPRTKVPTTPKLRLTYRALSYFQMRLALLYMRDVQDSDDTREF
jgi:hypothetical protein